MRSAVSRSRTGPGTWRSPRRGAPRTVGDGELDAQRPWLTVAKTGGDGSPATTPPAASRDRRSLASASTVADGGDVTRRRRDLRPARAGHSSTTCRAGRVDSFSVRVSGRTWRAVRAVGGSVSRGGRASARRRARGSPRASATRGSPRAAGRLRRARWRRSAGSSSPSLGAGHAAVAPRRASARPSAAASRPLASRRTPTSRDMSCCSSGRARLGSRTPDRRRARAPAGGGAGSPSRSEISRRCVARRPDPRAASWTRAGWRRARRCRPTRRRRTARARRLAARSVRTPPLA